MPNLGHEFEQAVYTFVQALDPSAEVLFNHSVLDRDTGKPRQCDVWINAKFGGHFPFSILVSCKDRKKAGRKLHVGDIGTFCSEIDSTGASMGVIYCNTGFSSSALKKAKANRIACCRLYQNEPPDIPEVIWLEHFACNVGVRLASNTDFTTTELRTWKDVFDTELVSEGQSTTVLDAIVKAIAYGEEEAVSKVKETGSFPPDWQMVLTFDLDKNEGELRILIAGRWKKYRARAEAVLIDGSYCLSDKSFQGSQTGPLIDLRCSHPGEAWIEMEDDESVPSSNFSIAVLFHGDVKTALCEEIGPRLLKQRSQNDM